MDRSEGVGLLEDFALFFFNDTATTEIYTLSLHDALPISLAPGWANFHSGAAIGFAFFWLLNVLVILRGIETIRFLQGISAPFLLLIGFALLLWARQKAGRSEEHTSELQSLAYLVCRLLLE